MSIERDSEGQIILETLDADDIAQLLDEIEKWVSETYRNWEQTYGPIEEVDIDELGQDGVKKAIEAADENHTWANLTYNSGSTVEPVPGLTLAANGWAYLPGKDNFRDEGESYAISAKPWVGSPYSIEPIYLKIWALCDFCEGTGERNDEECPGCDGSGELEFG